MSETDRLVIKYNNAATNDPCAICGARTDSMCGPELFVDGTWELVCHECGCKFSPELVGILRYIRSHENWANDLLYHIQGARNEMGLGNDDATVVETACDEPFYRNSGGWASS